MQELIGGIGKAIGSGLAQGLGVTLVKIVLVFLLVFLVLAVLGIVFLGLSVYFYKRKKKKAFLAAGMLSSFSFSLVLGTILSSKLSHNLSLAVVLVPILFILGIIFVIKKYQKL